MSCRVVIPWLFSNGVKHLLLSLHHSACVNAYTIRMTSKSVKKCQNHICRVSVHNLQYSTNCDQNPPYCVTSCMLTLWAKALVTVNTDVFFFNHQLKRRPKIERRFHPQARPVQCFPLQGPPRRCRAEGWATICNLISQRSAMGDVDLGKGGLGIGLTLNT